MRETRLALGRQIPQSLLLQTHMAIMTIFRGSSMISTMSQREEGIKLSGR